MRCLKLQGGVKWKKKEVKIAINYYFTLKIDDC